MGDTVSTADAILKDDYSAQVISSVLQRKVRLLKKIEEEDPVVWAGRQIKFPAEMNANWGVGFSGNGVLPTARNTEFVESTVLPKQCYGRVQLSRALMKQAKGDKYSFITMLGKALNGMIKTERAVFNRALWGDGTGKLAEVLSANDAADTITVKAPGTAGTTGLNGHAGARYIRKDMFLVVKTGSSTTVAATSLRVSAINFSTGVITFSGSPNLSGVAAGDSIYMLDAVDADAQNNEIMGVGGIADDGTYLGTLQGISRTTYPGWKCSVLSNSGTLRDLSEDYFQQIIDITDQASDETVDAFWCSHGMRNEAAKILKQAKVYIETKNQGRGIKESLKEDDLDTSVKYNETPVIAEKDCPFYTIFSLVYDKLKYAPIEKFVWVDEDGSIWRNVVGTDNFEAYNAMYGNMYSPLPSAFGVIRDINQSTYLGTYTPN